MADTDFGAATDAQKRVWSAEIWQDGRDNNFWFANGFIGKNDSDMNSVIHRITHLTATDRGTECVMQLVQDPSSDGVAGDNMLEGNEEALVNDTQIIRVDQLRHAFRSKGEMAEQATVVRFRATAKGKLSWWMSEKLDEMMWLVESGRAFSLTVNGAARGASQMTQLSYAADVVAASTNRIVHAGSATSEGTLTTADKMTWNTVIKARTAFNRKRMKPIRAMGKGFAALVISTEQQRDLETDNTFQTLYSRSKAPQTKNPLFTNAQAVVGGVAIHVHNKVYNTLDAVSGSAKWGAGNTVDGAQALLLGAQAGGFATIGDVFTRESDNKDYGNRPAFGAGRKIGMLKPQFPSIHDGNTTEDFGVISVKTAAAA